MELVDQHTKKIMEGCKERARDAGLRFDDETLEYIVTNRDLLELTPKLMIPTLYDYWVHDVEVLKEKGRYELYPHNPYETVINTRPAISFYNDNNPDWLNVMIFYHVLAHIDFFQNNLFFQHTWDYDFTGQALSDKRLVSKLRSEKGRWVDYVIEFSRGIDNLVGYHDELAGHGNEEQETLSDSMNFYFDVFLQSMKKAGVSDYIREIERYNTCRREYTAQADQSFFSEVYRKYPEFESVYRKYREEHSRSRMDLLQFILEYSDFLNKNENRWIKTIVEVVRSTSLFFQPQIRTKIMNEGWASYWHDKLFLSDDRIGGHEVDFAVVNAGVTSLPRVGINPYALGMRLFSEIKQLGDTGKYSIAFRRLTDIRERKRFNTQTMAGGELIFHVRRNFCDFTFINSFVDQDFVTRNKLFVTGKRLNQDRMVWEYYVKSKKAEDYRAMLLESLYHPPWITIEKEKSNKGSLYLNHHFEGKPLVRDFISNTMLGIEYLWGGPVKLETSEAITSPRKNSSSSWQSDSADTPEPIEWQRVLYSMNERKLSKQVLE